MDTPQEHAMWQMLADDSPAELAAPMTATPPFTLDHSPDAGNMVPTKAERTANYQAIMKLHPANRFRLMFGQTLLPEPKL